MHRTALSVLTSLLLVGTATADGPPEQITLEYHRGPGAPMPIRDHDHHYAYLFDSASASGQKWTGLVQASNPRNGSLVLPALRHNEIVPVFGALYRHEAARLARLKETPKGLAVAKDSFVVPLRRDGQGSGKISYRAKGGFEWKMVFVTEIAGEKPVAKVKLDDIRNKALEVRVGDVLKFGPTEWVVRSIVPPDREVLGWVELEKKAGK